MTTDDKTGVQPLLARPRDILAMATSSDPWSPAVTAAIALAARWASNLTSCYIEPSLRQVGGADLEPSALGLLLQPRGDDGGERAAFASHAHRLGVREAVWTVTHAGLAPTLRRLGAWHDLAVLERDMVEGAHLFDILGEAMLTSRIPCLLLPPGRDDEQLLLDRVAIGWNGGIEAVRAIHSALPFLQAAKEVLLIDGTPPGADDAEEKVPRFDPLNYLLRHNVMVRSRQIQVPPHLAGATLLKEAQGMHANLLVVGAYSHSRLRERVLGGATRHMLLHAEIPVLMQH
ncbi:universal stress protein [Rhodanobacter ginsengisoli]|uniref:Universal stress protein n=1 Tax=Rhodanobacter ginsengisoli TaxID=418646 RepID=A0ABW0QKD6_9GAMM